MADVNSFILYNGYIEQVDKLSDEQAGILFKTILRYQNGKELPELDAVTEMLFSFIRQNIDINSRKYQDKCKQAKEAAKKRWEDYKKLKESNLVNDMRTHTDAYGRIADGMHNDNDTDTYSYTDTDTGTDTYSDAITVTEDSITAVNSTEDMSFQIMELYNELCPSLPKCSGKTDKRISSINSLIKKGYSFDDFRKLFNMVEQSDFLSGRKSDFHCGIDWLINEDNMVKVLEGRYVNRNNSKSSEKPKPHNSFNNYSGRDYTPEQLLNIERAINGVHDKDSS